MYSSESGARLTNLHEHNVEARMEAHHCYPFEGGKDYANELIDGDIHAKNAVFFGTTRDEAKAPKYALTYGCQPPKLAETIGCSLEKAQGMFDSFWSGNTALKGYKDWITNQWRTNRGYIIGIDGRKIKIRSEHSIVNAAFQSSGSIVVKLATVLADKWCREQGLESQQILHMHDEFSYELPDHEEEQVKIIVEHAFREAGRMLEVRVPITGTAVFGKNWKEVH